MSRRRHHEPRRRSMRVPMGCPLAGSKGCFAYVARIGVEMKLWVDDERSIPDGGDWVSAYNYRVAIAYLNLGGIDILSLDHDLGENSDSGYAICQWMVENLAPAKWPTHIYIHSANPVGRENMFSLLSRYAPAFVHVFE